MHNAKKMDRKGCKAELVAYTGWGKEIPQMT